MFVAQIVTTETYLYLSRGLVARLNSHVPIAGAWPRHDPFWDKVTHSLRHTSHEGEYGRFSRSNHLESLIIVACLSSMMQGTRQAQQV